MNEDFNDRVSLVTGAGAGLGRAMAITFAKAGARVVVADVDLDTAKETAAEIGDAAIAVGVDVGDPVSVDQLVQHSIDTFGQIDVLCNNAGISDSLSLPAEIPIDEWDRVLRVNLTGTFLVARAVLPHMLGRRSGAIINIGSEASIRGGVSGAPYTASKHGVVGLTRHIAWVHSDDGIRCNALLPGPVRTEGVSDKHDVNPAGIERLAPLFALQQRWAQPQHMADAVLFLASDAASYINGAILPVDGGWSAG